MRSRIEVRGNRLCLAELKMDGYMPGSWLLVAISQKGLKSMILELIHWKLGLLDCNRPVPALIFQLVMVFPTITVNVEAPAHYEGLHFIY